MWALLASSLSFGHPTSFLTRNTCFIYIRLTEQLLSLVNVLSNGDYGRGSVFGRGGYPASAIMLPVRDSGENRCIQTALRQHQAEMVRETLIGRGGRRKLSGRGGGGDRKRRTRCR